MNKNTNEILTILQNRKSYFFEKYKINQLAIFGSYARGNNNERSDLDILVDFKLSPGIEYIDLAEELENLLKIKVDVVSKNAIKEKYLKYILKDMIYV